VREQKRSTTKAEQTALSAQHLLKNFVQIFYSEENDHHRRT